MEYTDNCNFEDRALQYVLQHLIMDEDKFYIGRCSRCGAIVLKSELPQYTAQCMECDEDLYIGEWHYRPIKNVTMYEFKELVRNTEAEIFG